MVLLAQSLQQGIGKARFVHAGLPACDGNSPFIDAPPGIRNHQLYVKLHLIAQTGTHRAGTEGIVERKTPWLDLADPDSAIGTGKTLAEGHGLPPDYIHQQKPFRQVQHILNGIRQTPLYPRPYRQTIHHDLDIVLDIFIQCNLLRQLVKITVYPHTHIAAAGCTLQYLLMPALPPPDHRSQKLQSGPFRQFHNLIHHLIHGLLCNLPTAVRTVGGTDPGIEQPEIIVNLRHGSHCRAGIAVGGFLVYGNSRRKPLDFLHIGFLHLTQELPCIGGQGFHVTTLPFRINRIKSQRGLP